MAGGCEWYWIGEHLVYGVMPGRDPGDDVMLDELGVPPYPGPAPAVPVRFTRPWR